MNKPPKPFDLEAAKNGAEILFDGGPQLLLRIFLTTRQLIGSWFHITGVRTPSQKTAAVSRIKNRA